MTMTIAPRTPLRILIADDETLARQRLRFLLDDIQKTHPTEILGEAANGKAALTLCTQYAADLLILDIEMPAHNGLEVARTLVHSTTPRPALLFTTAYRDHACEAFDVDAIDYLVKPVRIERLAHALDKVYARQLLSPLAPSMPSLRFAIPGRQHTQWIHFDQLLYFKAENKYTTVVSREGEHLIETSLTELELRYGEHLIRIHRNCIIMRQQLLELRHTSTGWHIRLRDWPDVLEVSRRQLPLLRTALGTSSQ